MLSTFCERRRLRSSFLHTNFLYFPIDTLFFTIRLGAKTKIFLAFDVTGRDDVQNARRIAIWARIYGPELLVLLLYFGD